MTVAAAAFAAVACAASDERAPLPPAMAAELATVVVTALETGSADPLLAGSDGRLVCVAEPFGADPVDAATAGDVTTVYAAVLCAEKRDGVAFEDSSRVSTVVAVHRSSPARVEAPGDGAAHQADIERIFPEDLRERAFAGHPDPGAGERELAARYTR
ncbi:hypothetical protein O7635_33935 [Asanoa sp. WMMD1127]|uniref:hypothetical protein n=1 Tax=Asanoa sp. WMMD1127 TaxID=3016107 RepID=UPI0024180DDB|nr:hypothetical protein [Asanoa sp. WMMD1127]MDG4826875.1 hypothetical protein [Asanoa sp. WMMD1127]